MDLYFALERLSGTIEKKLDTFGDILYAYGNYSWKVQTAAGVILGRQSHRQALLRCRGLVDETPRMEGTHLKTPEMYPTQLNPDVVMLMR
ncbi:UNVERIFIED_CONTAM: hypothetical protein FKN15_006084 [Acipenser sinensis]